MSIYLSKNFQIFGRIPRIKQMKYILVFHPMRVTVFFYMKRLFLITIMRICRCRQFSFDPYYDSVFSHGTDRPTGTLDVSF